MTGDGDGKAAPASSEGGQPRAAGASAEGPVPDTRRVAVRILGTGLGLLLASYVLTFAVAHAIVRHSTASDPMNTQELERADGIVEALPRLVERADRVVVALGPSTTVFAIDPHVVDQTLREAKVEVETWNLGIAGSSIEEMVAVSRVLKKASSEGKVRYRAGLVDIMPLWFSKRMGRDNRVGLLGALMRPMFWEVVFDSKRPNGLVGSILFRGRAEVAKDYVRSSAVAPPAAWAPPPGNPAIVALGSRLGKLSGRTSDFSDEGRGRFQLRQPGAEELYEEVIAFGQTPAGVKNTDEWLKGAFGVGQLEFDPAQEELYAELVSNLHASCETVVLFSTPVFTSALDEPSSKLMREEVLKVAQRTQEVLLNDLDAPGFVRAEFVDPVHLAENGGKARFSRLLAEQLGPVLRRERPPPP